MGPAIVRPVLEALIAPIARQPVEFGILCYIDAMGRLAGMRHLRGHRDGVVIPLRLVVAHAIAFDARTAIMAHNHPSGDAAASDTDLGLTRRVGRALRAVGVDLLDHVIVAGSARISLRLMGRH